ncbi:hypothetical protein F5883DRAFT_529060 [Diaporthe sp. PMI_573]|nr:hypothetical protein F5883DRAFT_529060 [Diaporthaceae sp. PMI_573]
MCAAFCQEACGVVDDAQPPRAYACLSEFQFDKSCMLEVMETAAGTDDDSATTTTTTDARMTLFYFTFEVVDEAAIAAARAVYGDFVPEYTYAGPLAQGHGQPDLNVWKIECTRGRPFSAL